VDGVRNWSNGWLPPLFQGTIVRSTEPRILNLEPPPHLKRRAAGTKPGLPRPTPIAIISRDIPARQTWKRASPVTNLPRGCRPPRRRRWISQEKAKATKKLYGLDEPVTREYGTRCLIARRLVERGVRFVQLFVNGQIWDNHESIKSSLVKLLPKDRSTIGRISQGPQARGLLDTTIVHWGGEIGSAAGDREPWPAEKAGRDHNGPGFSSWLGWRRDQKGGMMYGETDEFGTGSRESRQPERLSRQLLHLFGLDHTKLVTFTTARRSHHR